MTQRMVPFASARERAAAAGDVARHLHAGGWIAYPTETVYGIGCALLPGPLRTLAAAKRPGGHRPFLLLVPAAWSGEALRWTEPAKKLTAALWPGPLTLALDAEPGAFPPEVTAEDGSVAIRHSPHPAVQAIVEALGAPVTSTSANVPGEPPAHAAQEAGDAVRRLDPAADCWVLDGGELPPAAPSTLVRVTADGARILRAGAIGAAEIERVLGATDVD